MQRFIFPFCFRFAFSFSSSFSFYFLIAKTKISAFRRFFRASVRNYKTNVLFALKNCVKTRFSLNIILYIII